MDFLIGGDDTASGFVRLYLSSNVQFGISQHKCFNFCIDLHCLLKSGKPFAMFSPLNLKWKSNHTSFLFLLFVLPLCLSVSLYILYILIYLIYTLHTHYIHIIYIYIYKKSWKIINFKTLLKNEKELKRPKAMFLSQIILKTTI